MRKTNTAKDMGTIDPIACPTRRLPERNCAEHLKEAKKVFMCQIMAI